MKLGPYNIPGSYVGDCRELMAQLPDQCVQTCITSPPYWAMRDYGVDGQLGLEESPEDYVANIVDVFHGVYRILRDDGTLWLNMGDTYVRDGIGGGRGSGTLSRNTHRHSAVASLKVKTTSSRLPCKNMMGMPWRVAFALQADGWILRTDIIWEKPNAIPENVPDRPSRSHEYLFLLSRRPRYYYDKAAVKQPTTGNSHPRGRGVHPKSAPVESRIKANSSFSSAVRDVVAERNLRSVWTVPTCSYHGAHAAVFPPALIDPCVRSSTRPGDVVFDPFFGSGTTGEVAEKHGRRWLGFDLNPEYQSLQMERTAQRTLPEVSS